MVIMILINHILNKLIIIMIPDVSKVLLVEVVMLNVINLNVLVILILKYTLTELLQMDLYLTILWFVLKKDKNFSMFMVYKVFLHVLTLSFFVNKVENSVIIGVVPKDIVHKVFVIVLTVMGAVIVL